jgi:[ribosomal protein S5]-alanine N-acetyltransferase
MTSSAALERVQTDRLVCERLRMEHVPEVSRLLLDPRVAEWLWPGGQAPTQDEIRGSTEAKERHWERYGFGLWLLLDRLSGETLGWGGLQWTYVAELDEVEAAWAITPERWRQGLATELAHKSVETAFGPLALPNVIAFTLPHNFASRAVMEKAGFIYEREIVHVSMPHVLYRRWPDAKGA